MEKLRARFAGARAVAGLGDEAFSAQDQYLGGVLVFRKGARVAGVANVAAGADPAPLAKALARTAALGVQANSVWARVSRRATSTPCGQRTAHSAQSPQRTSRWAAGIARKCSRPSPNCP